MFSPIKTMFMYFPLRAWSTVLILLLISGTAYLRSREKWKTGELTALQSASQWLLVSYILVLLFFTVLGRRSLDFYRYNFDIGYSFREAFCSGTPSMIKLITVNILIFLPVGFLGILGAKRLGFLKALLLGLAVTCGIELSQLVLRNGTCEIDDVISNMIGTFFGGILGLIFFPVIRRVKIPAVRFRTPSQKNEHRKPAPENPMWVPFQIERMD